MYIVKEKDKTQCVHIFEQMIRSLLKENDELREIQYNDGQCHFYISTSNEKKNKKIT